MSRLEDNKKYFLKMLTISKLLYKKSSPNICLQYIEKMSYSAWHNFTGYYTSNLLEYFIRKISLQSLKFPENVSIKNEKDSTLHIFSEISEIGGHSKLIFTWIENDVESKHFLLSTRQRQDEIIRIAKSYNYSIANNLFTFEDKEGIIDKAQSIINLLQTNVFNRVILHIHPNDVIPSMVFSSEKITVPIFFLNHAEHTFWLGAPIIDFLLQIRESNIQKDFQNRGIPKEQQFFLPICVDEIYTRKRKKTNIFNILSIGREVKYEPNKEYNFFSSAIKILEKFEHVVFTIIGIATNSPIRNIYKHERLIFVHPTRELKDYIEKTDLYLEGFPIPSFMSLLEPAIAGIPFVLHYNPASIYKIFENNIKNGIFYPENFEKWYQEVEKMIEDERYREHTNTLQFNYLKENYSSDAWRKKLKEIKEITKHKKHKIRSIKNYEKCYNNRDEQLVSVIETKKIEHYKYTFQLGFISRLWVIILSINNPIWVKTLSKKQTIKYLLNIS